ncbi:hypothetical protein PFICI_15048 [Pestalotiopsis fici W106-1]|uniref:Zn(2)-C6 fungal-type domain-containing protein n=1 Tax=Pestalotiopsis fici (strain W106-1 / CGMCC3.15140) TaxID=1229662 RepID=W3WHS2_PESFW|nr:uncharacterized protein PFICI_15048 [Pestalotiopsis fici W106-1]ETS73443.1 hypothetical protein PFICI_15048 [Pestalotiopsis fici W106-1]
MPANRKQMSQPASSGTTVPQIACTRCRRRKKKCDHALPTCGQCLRSGVECVRFLERKPRDSAVVPWDFVKHLEARIARLEKRVSNCTCHRSEQHSPSQATASSNHTSPPRTWVEVPDFVHHADHSDADADSRSRVSLNIVQSRSDVSPLDSHMHMTTPPANDEGNNQNSGQHLPVRERDLHNYLEYVHPNWSLLEEDDLSEWFAAHVKQRITEKDHYKSFFVLLACAIGALYSTPSEGASPQHERSQALRKEAVSRHLQHATSRSPTMRTQAYLLIVIHALHCPTPFELHDITNEAILEVTSALCNHTSGLAMSPEMDESSGTHRFVLLPCFSAYQIIASLWSRPFPSLVASMDRKIEEQGFWLTYGIEQLDAATEHVFSVRVIQSKIQRLWSPSQGQGSQECHRIAGVRGIATELMQWRAMIPLVSNHAHKSTNSHPLAMLKLYDLCIFNLYQNESHVPDREETLALLFAASESIRCFRRIQLHRPQVYYTWSGLFEQFRAGITLLSCFWETDHPRRAVVFAAPETHQALEDCELTLECFTRRWESAWVFLKVYKLILSTTPLWPRDESDFTVPKATAERLSPLVRQLQQSRVSEAVISMINRVIARA